MARFASAAHFDEVHELLKMAFPSHRSAIFTRAGRHEPPLLNALVASGSNEMLDVQTELGGFSDAQRQAVHDAQASAKLAAADDARRGVYWHHLTVRLTSEREAVLPPVEETVEPSLGTYAIVLVDPGDRATVHTFDRPELWAWLQRDEVFAAGASRIFVTVPGIMSGSGQYAAPITIGSPTNDKAIAIASGTGDQPHPWVRKHADIENLEEYDATLARLRRELGEGLVFEGFWY
ncbi:hypothetical protein ACFVU2_19480 [Leifsonia sp. NPDC058194]|uniref:hypothetical protein n=1 Tax=Leifsonia sp. NPDC058194 TaxID=3346374 RepID=UPI0036DA07B2